MGATPAEPICLVDVNLTVKMESLADKVRYGAGTRFDPMMEERGGWIAGEVQPQDAEMLEAVMEVLAEANH